MATPAIYNDPIKQYSYLAYHNDKEIIHEMFINIKSSIEEHASDWFPNVVISTHDDTSGETLYQITLYDKDDDPVLTIKQRIYTNSNTSYNIGYYIEIIAHALNMDVTNDNVSYTSYYDNKLGRRWFVSKITYNEKFISFSFASTAGETSGVTDEYMQGSSIFLVKTNHDNIAVIRGDNGNGLISSTSSDSYPGPTNSAFHINNTTINKINYLSCVTKESVSVGRDVSSIWGLPSSQETIFVLRNIAVVGVSDDYCIDTYYAATSPFILGDAVNCIINIADEPYFTNGIIFVKL